MYLGCEGTTGWKKKWRERKPIKGAFLKPLLQWAMLCLVTQLCPTLCDPMVCSPPGSSVHGDSPSKNTGVGCRSFLQGIFPTQGSNPGLPHCRRILKPAELPGKCSEQGKLNHIGKLYSYYGQEVRELWSYTHIQRPNWIENPSTNPLVSIFKIHPKSSLFPYYHPSSSHQHLLPGLLPIFVCF